MGEIICATSTTTHGTNDGRGAPKFDISYGIAISNFDCKGLAVSSLTRPRIDDISLDSEVYIKYRNTTFTEEELHAIRLNVLSAYLKISEYFNENKFERLGTKVYGNNKIEGFLDIKNSVYYFRAAEKTTLTNESIDSINDAITLIQKDIAVNSARDLPELCRHMLNSHVLSAREIGFFGALKNQVIINKKIAKLITTVIEKYSEKINFALCVEDNFRMPAYFDVIA